jgi:predicted ATPase
MALVRAVFNTSHIVFEVDGSGRKSFLPKLSDLTAEQRLLYFEQLMNILADSFVLLPSDRYLTKEASADEDKQEVLSPKTFKTWLFKLSLKRNGHEKFEEIKAMFRKPPFQIGEIGFSKESGEIDIMVQEPKVRLPIGRLGSGHQQFLYIIANLILNKKKMLGIEELEVNLSPTNQKILFEKLKDHVNKTTDLVSQVIVTSHSDYFDPKHHQDVICQGLFLLNRFALHVRLRISIGMPEPVYCWIFL